ncbi:hypothetical protein EI94DRAFT_552948 [Lactarius quietus]|nr:hypothetical protein EI94DRAFT_552948 [Lactarius quietus]
MFERTQEETPSPSQNSIDVTMTDLLPGGLNMQAADVILQSSDLVAFHVHKLILALSSSFFNDIFSLPQPCVRREVVYGLPVVHVSEDAEVLQALLTVLYPVPTAIPDSYEKALALLAALQKYEMSKIISAVRTEICRKLPTTVDAYRAYAIASRNGSFQRWKLPLASLSTTP